MVLHRPLAPEGRAARRPAAGAVPCAEVSRPWVLAATILASAMAFIDGSVVTIALPVIQRELGAGLAALQWVVNGYMLFLASLLLVGGAAGDRFGRRRVFLAGTLLFAAASVACALAPGTAALVAARAAQGVGAALMVPQSLAIISAAFPPEIRGRAIGTWAGAAALTTAVGPAVGGLLIDSLGWRAAFWINLPLAAAVVVLARTHVPESRSPAAGPLDWPGAAAAVAASALATLGLGAFAGSGGGWRAAALLAAGAAAAVVFVRIERRAAAPLVPMPLFAVRAFAGANLLTLCLYGALSAALFLLPFDLIGRRGLSPGAVGLVLLPMGLVIGVVARPAGTLADRLGVRGFLVAGSSLVAAAALWLALAAPAGLAVGVVLPVLLLAAGMALVVAPLTTAVMNAAPDALAGAASGINNAASRLAGLFAVALAGTVAALVFGAAGGAGASFGVFPPPGDPSLPPVTAAFGQAWRAGMAVAVLLAALAAAVGWATIPPRSDFSNDSS